MKQVSGSGNNLSYKPLIKNISIEPVSSNRQKSTDSNNKTFFSNIKAQLNNIRTDVNKLVSKDPAKPLNINKSYNVGPTSKNDITLHTEASTNIEKKLYIDNSEKYNTTMITLESKLSKTTNQLHQQISKNSQMLSQFQQQRKNQMQLRNQIGRLKQNYSRLQYQLISKGKQLQNCKSLLQMGNKQKEKLLSHIEQLQLELRKNPPKLQRANSQADPETLERLRQQQKLIIKLQNEIKYYQEENKRLNQNLQIIENKKQAQIASIMKNYEQKINRAEAKTYKELGSGFQVKINELLDENYSLKNKIHLLQNHREQERVKLESLTSTIEAYEARDRQIGKGANEIQMQNLRNKVMQLQEQMDKMESEHEFEIMKLQNLIDELKENSGNKSGDNKSFNQILKDQINEIENLKQKLKQKTQIINKLKR